MGKEQLAAVLCSGACDAIITESETRFSWHFGAENACDTIKMGTNTTLSPAKRR